MLLQELPKHIDLSFFLNGRLFQVMTKIFRKSAKLKFEHFATV